MLARQVQHLTAGNQNLERRTRRQQVTHLASLLDDVLEVVEHQQHALRLQGIDERVQQRLALDFFDPDGFADRRREQLRIGERREGNEEDAAWKLG